MWRKKSILLIDDNNDEMRVFINAFNELGVAYNCSYAQNPQQGLKILHGLTPDFIFLDMNCADNVECLSQIKKIKNKQDVPLIVYSKPVDDEIRKAALKLGSVVFIKKTSSLRALTEALKTILTPTQKEIQLLFS